MRRDKPGLAHLCDAARQQEERALERTQYFQALAEQVRQTRNRSPRLTKEEGQWIDGLLADMERETESLAAWLDMVRCRRHQPGSAPDDGDRTPPAWEGEGLDAGLQYEKVLQEVIKLRRVVAAIAAERRRAEDILSDEARRTANQSPAFRVAETEMHAALAELLTSLLHKAMLPEMHALIADSHRA